MDITRALNINTNIWSKIWTNRIIHQISKLSFSRIWSLNNLLIHQVSVSISLRIGERMIV